MPRSCLRRPAALLALASGLLACSEEHPGDVLLITVDALRPDHLGLYGYHRDTSPHIDRWFADAAVFERAWSTEANTSPSVASLLTGLLPQQHRVRLLMQLLPEETKILPDLLPEAWVSAAFVSNPVLSDESMGMAARFDHYDDYVAERADTGPSVRLFERRAEHTTTAALEWLRSERDRERPLFLWLHYIDPHAPYDAPPETRPDFQRPAAYPWPAEPPPPEQRRGRADHASALALVDRYDEEIHYVDREIGRLLEGYTLLQGIDRALVFFTADHGESMLEHESWFTHGYQVYDEIVRVPLLLRGPGVVPGRRPGPASGIDVATTILAFAGVPPPEGSRGVDLREPIPADRPVFVEATRGWHRRAVVQGTGKWVLRMPYGGEEIVGHRYYDLARDPDETRPEHDLPEAPGLASLRELLERDPDAGGLPRDARRGMLIEAPKVSPRASPEQLEQLRALGYVE